MLGRLAMGLVVSSKKIRDKVRWLWEMRVECGHLHYEPVEKCPASPVNVLCRVCGATHRLQVFLASLSDRELYVVRGNPILSELAPERVRGLWKQNGNDPIPCRQDTGSAFKLDGGFSVQAAALPDPPAPPDPSVSIELPAGPAVGLYPLPACMQPRPGAAMPGPRNIASSTPTETICRDAKAPKGRKRGQDPGQGSLFAV